MMTMMGKSFKHLACFLLLAAFSAPVWLGAAPLPPVGEVIAQQGLAFDRPTSDSRFARPLKEVLGDLELRFGVKFRYGRDIVEDDTLEYADYRIRPWSLEETLWQVLLPFDYKFVKTTDTSYEIKRFEYARGVAVDGRQKLEYLSTLYQDRESWEARKEVLRTELRHNAGLDVMPARPDSKPYLSPRRVYDGYYVQNIGLEILPGVYCTGSIYHPLKYKRRGCPIILNPNGHFGDGRYRPDEQKRCAMQAMMGCIAVSYDLFAWDEQMLQFDSRSHRTAAAHTIQSLNAIRLLDYLLSLKEADPTRVGITGGSGGGSQTMFITAIDERITLSMPVVMTSSYFVGGCPCESGNPIHLSAGGTNNAELAAMCAPRPLLVVSDGRDWTADVPQIEFPFIQRTFGFYGAVDKAENAHFPAEGHDYGLSKRLATYDFLERHWQLDTRKLKDAEGRFDESRCTVEPYSLLKVWGENGENLPGNAVQGIENLYKMLKAFD